MWIGNPHEPNGNPHTLRNGRDQPVRTDRLTIPQQFGLRVPDRVAAGWPRLSEVCPDIGGNHLLTLYRDVYDVAEWTNHDYNDANKALIWRALTRPDFGEAGRFDTSGAFLHARYVWELTFNYNLVYIELNNEPGQPIYTELPVQDTADKRYWCLMIRAAEPNLGGPEMRYWQFYYYPAPPGANAIPNPFPASNMPNMREGQPIPFSLGDMWRFEGPAQVDEFNPYSPVLFHGSGATIFEKMTRPNFPENIPETVWLTPLVM